MKTIQTPTLHVTRLDEITVLVEARPEVEIDAGHARRDNDLIANLMTADYGMIVDRKADYSIVPVDVYRVLNGMDRLKALAIVAHRPITALSTATERSMFKRAFRMFSNIEEAHAWVRGVVAPPSPGSGGSFSAQRP